VEETERGASRSAPLSAAKPFKAAVPSASVPVRDGTAALSEAPQGGVGEGVNDESSYRAAATRAGKILALLQAEELKQSDAGKMVQFFATETHIVAIEYRRNR
jgi:hypothetical protein